jgi:hypothetical protein
MSQVDNLVGSVADAIAVSNPAAAMRFTRAFVQRSDDTPGVLRELNRYWRDELSRLNISTISARTCLIDDISPEDWLRHFKKLVLEVILDNDLPRG